MADSIEITKSVARTFLLNYSMLGDKKETIEEVLRELSCIQVDPLGTIARNHELALYNRVKNFRASLLQEKLYSERSLFEYWLQLYSIIPVEYFPYFRQRMEHRVTWHDEFEKEHRNEIVSAIDYIMQNGPSSSRDLAHIKTRQKLFSWNSAGQRTAILEYLWDTGKVCVSYRDKNRKYFDIPERVVPKEIYNKRATQQESIEFLINAAFSYTPILSRSQFHKVSRLGYAKNDVYKKRFDELIDEGKITKLKIEKSTKQYYMRKDDLQHLTDGSSLSTHEAEEITTILSPLDPFIIDRGLIQDVFDFSYLWEAYVPLVKRKFDHYGMPVLHAGRFVGQIAVRREDKQLKIVKSTVTQKYLVRCIERELLRMREIKD